MAPFAYITNYASSSVSVIDTATNTVVATVQLDRQSVGSPSGVAVTPDGKHVYVTAGDHIVAVIDTATNTVVATVDVSSPGAFAPATGGAFAPFGVAVTPDGKRVYVANQSFWCVLPCNFMDIVAVIDTATNTVVATVSLPATTEPFGVAVTPDGKSVYVTGQHSNTVEVIDTATNTDVASVPVIFPQGVAVTPDGKRVYVASGTNVTGTVSVIDTATNTVVTSVPVGIAPYGVAVAPDGARVYVTNEFDNTVSVIDTAMNRVVGSPIPVGSVPRGVAVAPDGARVYVANYGGNGIGNGTVSVIDTATNTVVATVGVGVLPVAFGKFITPGSSILWGVDSLLPATPDLFIALKDQAGAPPAFWGRYIGEHDALSPGEVTLMRNNNCRVLVIFRDTTNGELKTKPKAIAQARAAIRIAQKQMIPSGVWIYADTEFPDQSPTAEWFAGWFETLQGQGSPYGAGVYGNTSNGAVPKFGKAFCDAYPHFPNPAAAYVYTNQAKPGQPKPGCDFKNRNFDPAVLQCNPPTVIQQYALKCAVPGTTRSVDLDLANAAGFASMWKP